MCRCIIAWVEMITNQVIKVNIPRIGKRKPWRHASPSDYHVGRINYTSCWKKDTLVLNGGTYQILVTNCRIDITRSVGFNNMIVNMRFNKCSAHEITQSNYTVRS